MTKLLNTLPPKTRTIGAPEGGWQENSLYLVEVSFRPGNPIHCAIMFTGFLNGPDDTPGGYNALFHPHWSDNATISDLHFLHVVRPLGAEDQIFHKE